MSLFGVRVGLGGPCLHSPDCDKSPLWTQPRPASKGYKSDSLYCIHAIKSPKNDPWNSIFQDNSTIGLNKYHYNPYLSQFLTDWPIDLIYWLMIDWACLTLKLSDRDRQKTRPPRTHSTEPAQPMKSAAPSSNLHSDHSTNASWC